MWAIVTSDVYPPICIYIVSIQRKRGGVIISQPKTWSLGVVFDVDHDFEGPTAPKAHLDTVNGNESHHLGRPFRPPHRQVCALDVFFSARLLTKLPATPTDYRVSYTTSDRSGREHASAAHRLDLLLGQLGELLGLDNQRLLGQLALAKHLEDALRAREGKGSGGAGGRWRGGRGGWRHVGRRGSEARASVAPQARPWNHFGAVSPP